MNRFLDTLWNEHRSIAAVLHAMLFLVREQREHGRPVHPPVLRATLYDLDDATRYEILRWLLRSTYTPPIETGGELV